MEVTEQTEENDWTKVNHKRADRRNNTNKINETERNEEMVENRRRTEKNEKKENTVDRTTAENNQINETKKICYFWITDKCKFGQKCNYEHPIRCREHMMWGKCKKKNCELAHPKMCRNMIKDRYCSRSNCWFNHPNEIQNRYVFGNGKHGQNYNQN